MEVLEAVCEEEYRWAFGSRGANFMGNETPLSLKNKKKRHNIVPLAATKVTMLDPFLRVIRGSGK